MIAQVILLLGLLLLFAYALTQRQKSQFLSYVVIAVSINGGYLVLFPQYATVAAQHVGIGRGADLITYAFILLAIVAIFNLHLRLRAEREVLTQIIREIAIINAQRPDK